MREGILILKQYFFSSLTLIVLAMIIHRSSPRKALQQFRIEKQAGRYSESRSPNGWFDPLKEGRPPYCRQKIARLVARHPQLIGVGSVDPDRLGVEGAVAEAERAVKTLGLKAINGGARVLRAAAPFRRSPASSGLRSATGVVQAGLSDDRSHDPRSRL
jgi:hypothetical protein